MTTKLSNTLSNLSLDLEALELKLIALDSALEDSLDVIFDEWLAVGMYPYSDMDI